LKENSVLQAHAVMTLWELLSNHKTTYSGFPSFVSNQHFQ